MGKCDDVTGTRPRKLLAKHRVRPKAGNEHALYLLSLYHGSVLGFSFCNNWGRACSTICPNDVCSWLTGQIINDPSNAPVPETVVLHVSGTKINRSVEKLRLRVH